MQSGPFCCRTLTAGLASDKGRPGRLGCVGIESLRRVEDPQASGIVERNRARKRGSSASKLARQQSRSKRASKQVG